MKHINITTILLLLFATACEDFGTTEVLKPKGDKPVMILNALFNAEDDTHEAELKMTGFSCTTPVPHAEIKLFVNGEIKEIVTSDTCVYLFHTHFRPGDKVRIEAKSDSLGKTVSAVCEVPQPVEITNVQKIDLDDNAYWQKTIKYAINIRKTSNERHYYRLTIDDKLYYGRFSENRDSCEINMYEKRPSYGYMGDIALTDNYTYEDREFAENYFDIHEKMPNRFGIFNSDYFTNNQYTINITSEREELAWYELYWRTLIKVRSISEDEYDYLKAVNANARTSKNSELLQPTIITPSNIAGGTGIFSISSCTTLSYEYVTDMYDPEYICKLLIDNGYNDLQFDYTIVRDHLYLRD